MKIGENNYIQQLQLHNEDALIYVMEAYGGLLKSVIGRHLFSMPDKAEECLNDVLLNIWEHIGSFDEKRNSFKNWAAAIARYRAVDYLRKYHQKMQQIDIEEVEIAKEDAVLEGLLEQEAYKELKGLLKCLKEKDRSLFWKLYVEEKSMEEISRETGMDKNVIYNRISRGRRRIRKQSMKEREA